MTRKPTLSPSPTRRSRGFEPASGLVRDPVRFAGESRGFAVARLLTHWAEVAGESLAGNTRPVKIGYGREGMGATLTLLVRAAEAPIVQMALPALKDRVNAVYGYAAISRIHLTQTAPSGFADGQAEFRAAPKMVPAPDPLIVARAAEVAGDVGDPTLRTALEALGQNILTRRKASEGKTS